MGQKLDKPCPILFKIVETLHNQCRKLLEVACNCLNLLRHIYAIMGVTIISVGLWRKAEQQGHGRGGHFAVALWMTVLPAPLAYSSHCPAFAWSPGTCRSCSPSSSISWSSCTVLPAVFVFGGLFVALCICFIRGFDGVSGGSGSWYSRSSSSCRCSEASRSRGACEFRTVLGHLDSSQRSTGTCLAA